MTEGKDRLSVRIRAGLSVGEQANGFLSLDDSSENYRWFRFVEDENNELWITCLLDFYIETTEGKVKKILINSDTKIQLGANEIFVCKDPFQINESVSQITIRPVFNQQIPLEASGPVARAPQISRIDLHSTGFFERKQSSQAWQVPFGVGRDGTMGASPVSIDTLGTSRLDDSEILGPADAFPRQAYAGDQNSEALAEPRVLLEHTEQNFPLLSDSQNRLTSSSSYNFVDRDRGHNPGRKAGRKTMRSGYLFLFAGTATGAVLSILLFSLYGSGQLLSSNDDPLDSLHGDISFARPSPTLSEGGEYSTIPRSHQPNALTIENSSGQGKASGNDSGPGVAEQSVEGRVSLAPGGKADSLREPKRFGIDEDWRLVRARNSLLKGEIITPGGSNAVAYLQNYLIDNPGSEVALDLLHQCASQLINLAVEQHQRGKFFEARNTLEEVLGFDQNNERANLLWNVWRG